MKTLLFSLLLICGLSQAQNERVKGLVIEDFGGTYAVPQLDIPLDTTTTFKVLFDLCF